MATACRLAMFSKLNCTSANILTNTSEIIEPIATWISVFIRLGPKSRQGVETVCSLKTWKVLTLLDESATFRQQIFNGCSRFEIFCFLGNKKCDLASWLFWWCSGRTEGFSPSDPSSNPPKK